LLATLQDNAIAPTCGSSQARYPGVAQFAESGPQSVGIKQVPALPLLRSVPNAVQPRVSLGARKAQAISREAPGKPQGFFMLCPPMGTTFFGRNSKVTAWGVVLGRGDQETVDVHGVVIPPGSAHWKTGTQEE
jgi:hypothetical protein